MSDQPGLVQSRQVSLKRLKVMAMRSLPESSPARAVILCQPDGLPESEYFPFAKLVSRQLANELAKPLP